MRRPEHAPERAAWEILLAVHRGALGPVVAACPACGQPMCAETDSLPTLEWVLQTPEGPLAVHRHGLRGPQGPIDWAEAERLVNKHFPEPSNLKDWVGPRALWSVGMVSTMLVPVLLFVAAGAAIAMFLFNVWR